MQQFKAFEVNFGNKIFFSLLRSNNIPLVSFEEDNIKSPLDEILKSVMVDLCPFINDISFGEKIISLFSEKKFIF